MWHTLNILPTLSGDFHGDYRQYVSFCILLSTLRSNYGLLDDICSVILALRTHAFYCRSRRVLILFTLILLIGIGSVVVGTRIFYHSPSKDCWGHYHILQWSVSCNRSHVPFTLGCQALLTKTEYVPFGCTPLRGSYSVYEIPLFNRAIREWQCITGLRATHPANPL